MDLLYQYQLAANVRCKKNSPNNDGFKSSKSFCSVDMYSIVAVQRNTSSGGTEDRQRSSRGACWG